MFICSCFRSILYRFMFDFINICISSYFFFFFLMIRRPPRSTRMTHSFPTRRSSDLHLQEEPRGGRRHLLLDLRGGEEPSGAGRSEEHTSELQSLMRISYAVFCLKKKK